MRHALLLAPVLTLTLALTLSANDWPQFMGPNRDGVWAETGILKAFPPDGPKVLWRVPVGGGYAGPSVAGGKVFVADKVLKPGAADSKDPFAVPKGGTAATERVLCLDAKTGKEQWKHEYDVAYKVQYPAGPRCTPLVHDGKVYALGAMGDLRKLDAASGKLAWAKNFPKDCGAKVPQWGFAGHPLVYKNLLVCLVGGKDGVVQAFDKDTGEPAWAALSASEPGYNSPTLIEAGGVTQLVVWTSKELAGLSPDTGKVYWSVPLAPEYAMSIMVPRKDGDLLYAAGHGHVGVAVKLDATKPAVTEVWRHKVAPTAKVGVYPVNMTPFADAGVVYGVDQSGAFLAVELATGKRLWATFKPVFGEDKPADFAGGSSGTAFVVKNADRYFLFNEVGELVIAKLTPQGYEELGKAKLLDPTGPAFGRKAVWSHPAFAGKCVFARNDKEVVCASLAE